MSVKTSTSPTPKAAAPSKERLDKFLFFSRAIKSRTLAQKFIEAGEVRVNGERTISSDFKIGAGDVLTMTLGGQLRLWRIVSHGERRGPASEAQLLYQDISPPPLPREQKTAFEQAIGVRDVGSGRPTKKQRRDTDSFNDTEDD